MKRYFSEKALLQIKNAIAETGGNEVFFLGRTDETQLVVEAEPLARGNRDAAGDGAAVPAIPSSSRMSWAVSTSFAPCLIRW